ncbi:hypothetical protein ACXM0W_004295 [Escherichia coli]
MKQMSLIEMDGFLKGKCIPRDLKVNETNAEYLVRKFTEAEAKISALSEDHQRAIESIKQADAAVKLAHEKFSALAAENAGLKAICDDRRRFIMNGVQMGYIKVPAAETDPDLETIRIAISPQKPIPATDAFLSEVRAQGVEMFSEKFGGGTPLSNMVKEVAADFAAKLRKGGNQ